jgi:hypothetical protein
MKKLTFLTLLTLSLIFSCTKPPAQQGWVTVIIGSVTLERSGEVPRPAAVKDELKQGDILATGPGACAVMQVADRVLFRMESSSRLTVDSLFHDGKVNVSLEKGALLSKIQKLDRGYEVSVKTPTVLAAVRGTEFLTTYSKGSSVIAVGQGTVEVRDSAGEKPEAITGGSAAVVEQAITIRPVTERERIELKKLEPVTVTAAVETSEAKVLAEIETYIVKQNEEIEKELDQLAKTSGISIDEIRLKYGKVDRVYLYNGRVIEGAILSRGATIKMITPTGLVTVKTETIKRSEVR